MPASVGCRLVVRILGRPQDPAAARTVQSIVRLPARGVHVLKFTGAQLPAESLGHPGRKLIPGEAEARWHALRLQAVAQGLADAGIAIRWETVRRPRGHIALATCLSWLEFRGLPGLRSRRPRLVAWLDEFETRPSMRATLLSGETQD